MAFHDAPVLRTFLSLLGQDVLVCSFCCVASLVRLIASPGRAYWAANTSGQAVLMLSSSIPAGRRNPAHSQTGHTGASNDEYRD
jgi:hypothetical protein